MEPGTASTIATTTGGGGGGSLGVLIVWLAGYFHVDMTAEVGAVIGILTAGIGAAVGAYGIRGCCSRVWNGSRRTTA